METHDFPADTQVTRFCLTLTGEARLWYETLRPVQLDWAALQEHFTQQYSKFGSTREQSFMCGDHFIMMKTQILLILM